MKDRVDRRGFLKTTGAALLGAALPMPWLRPRAEPGVLRVAQFSDVHMDGSEQAIAGFKACLESIKAANPDLIVDTGDAIMDSLFAPKEAAVAQWKTYKDVLAEVFESEEPPVKHVLGNHDVWGWGFPEGIQQKLSRSDPQFGKKLAQDQLGLERSFYSFDKGGWHFIALDSMSPASPNPTVSLGIPYVGRLDEVQFAWLEAEVNDHPGPICILSHIPILSGCELFDGDNEVSGNWIVPGAWVHIDARRFRNLFLARAGSFPFDAKVLCLSGHTHQLEVLDHLGVRYVTNGSVCGDWWGQDGHYLDTPRGYALVSLFDDGTAVSEYVTY